jgi:ABC-2 type transport system ATP-binding protein
MNAAMPEPVISFQHVTKRFDKSQPTVKESLARLFDRTAHAAEFTALDDVDFTIEQGETVALVGPNGAGKSTILKLIAGVYKPDEGKVSVHGRVAPLIELGAGFHQDLSGRENVFLNGIILGMTRAEVRAKFDQIVEFAELAAFIDEPVKHYSSGMYLRLAFAVAIHTEPDILLLDEVLSVGDMRFQEKCIAAIQTFVNDAKKTVVFVSHDDEQVEALCQRALLVYKGEVRDDGPATEVLYQYRGLEAGAEVGAEVTALLPHSHKRWGSFAAKFEVAEFEHRSPLPPVFQEENETIPLHVRVRAKADVSTIHLGVQIKRIDGDVVYEYSTAQGEAPLKNWKADEKRFLELHVPNIFAKGSYLVSLFLHGKNAQDTFDWWDNALRFRVHRAETASTSVVVPFSVKKITTK